jgi:D-sedoheptulose 7-phosphate isomerase
VTLVLTVDIGGTKCAHAIAMTGRDGGELGKTATLHINVAEQHMGRIEDAHLAICHMLAFSFIDTES